MKQENQKKAYQSPKTELSVFATDDVVRTSGGENLGGIPQDWGIFSEGEFGA